MKVREYYVVHALSNLFYLLSIFVYCKHMYDSTVKAID